MIHKEQALKKGIKIIDSKESHNALFENLKTHFPQTIKDNQVDLKAIATLLGLETKANIQGYELTFTGKALANALYSTPTQKLLKFEYCFNACNTESVILRKSEISKGLDSQKDISGGRPQYDKVGSHSEALAEESSPIYHSDLERSEREESNSKEDSKVEVSCDDFVGCQGGGEGDSHANNIEQDTQRVQDFGDKNGALQSEARELPKVVMTEAETKQSPFLAQKTSTQETMPTTTSQNFIIKGDNLDVLKILKSAYSEKIKMIYIDPPYNTKSDNFIYPDNFRKDYKAILQEVGLLEIDDEGNEVESETLQFFKNIQGSRTHSAWLSFMLPRLKLARDLLREDGVIFISIDDNEQANLKILCDEIFGEENFVVCAVNENVKIRKNSAKTFSMSHDSVLIYTKNIDSWDRNLLPRTDLSGYKNPDNDPRGVWIPIPIHANHHYEADYKITKPNGVILEKPKNVSWRLSEENFKKHVEENRIWWGNGNSYPMIKRFLSEVQDGLVPRSIFYYDETGGNPAGDKVVKELFNDIKVFDNPKSVELIKIFLKISTNANTTQENQKTIPLQEADIVLDFFAGSGTTAHAVMELNAEDNGNRKFILVQIDEPINESKNKTAYDFCKNELKSKNPAISDITIERVKRASVKIANANPNFNVGFNVLSLSDKPELITTKQGTLKLLSNANLSPFDKALNLALQSGKTLDKPLKTIFENKLYQCEDCLYLIACDKEVLEFLRKSQNEYIFIDGFEDINLEDFLNLDSSLNDRLRVVY